MAESKEIIEAKLCAYVDDELTDAERAEIELHLEANPGHRLLIEQLRQTRDMLGQLPRIEAPPEIIEAVQGQLERDSLLINAERDLYPSESRLWRWPQMTLIAAMLLLAMGLAFVVWNALPSTHPGTFNVASDTTLGQSQMSSPADMERSTPRLLSKSGDVAAAVEPVVPQVLGKGLGVPVATEKVVPEIVLLVEASQPRRLNGYVAEVLVSNRMSWTAGTADNSVLANMDPASSIQAYGLRTHVDNRDSKSALNGDTSVNSAIANASAPSGTFGREGEDPSRSMAFNNYVPSDKVALAEATARAREKDAPTPSAAALDATGSPVASKTATSAELTPAPVPSAKDESDPSQPAALSKSRQMADAAPGNQTPSMPGASASELSPPGVMSKGGSQEMPPADADKSKAMARSVASVPNLDSAQKYVVENITADQAKQIMQLITDDASAGVAEVYESRQLATSGGAGALPNAATSSVPQAMSLAQRQSTPATQQKSGSAAVEQQQMAQQPADQMQQLYPQQTLTSDPQVSQRQYSAQDGNFAMADQPGGSDGSATQPAVNAQHVPGAMAQGIVGGETASPLRVGQEITVTVQEFSGSKFDTVTRAQVRSDGMIVLPLLGPVQASGLTAEQLRGQIVQEFAAANMIPSATVTVTPGNVVGGAGVQTVATATTSQQVRLTIVVQPIEEVLPSTGLNNAQEPGASQLNNDSAPNADPTAGQMPGGPGENAAPGSMMPNPSPADAQLNIAAPSEPIQPEVPAVPASPATSQPASR